MPAGRPMPPSKGNGRCSLLSNRGKLVSFSVAFVGEAEAYSHCQLALISDTAIPNDPIRDLHQPR